MQFSSFGEVPVVINDEERDVFLRELTEIGGGGGGEGGAEKGFWLPSNIHTVIQMSAISNLLKATLDLSRTQQYNEKLSLMKSTQANEYPEMNLELQQLPYCPGHLEITRRTQGGKETPES